MWTVRKIGNLKSWRPLNTWNIEGNKPVSDQKKFVILYVTDVHSSKQKAFLTSVGLLF